MISTSVRSRSLVSVEVIVCRGQLRPRSARVAFVEYEADQVGSELGFGAI